MLFRGALPGPEEVDLQRCSLLDDDQLEKPYPIVLGDKNRNMHFGKVGAETCAWGQEHGAGEARARAGSTDHGVFDGGGKKTQQF